MFLHLGLEKPTPEMMEKWKVWLDVIADRLIDPGGFATGRDWDCITGYNIIGTENMDEAGKLALGNPFISSIRVYEIR